MKWDRAEKSLQWEEKFSEKKNGEWTMKLKYEVGTKKFEYLKDKIEIPRFQRGLRWSKEKQKAFIKTLKAGLPIGTLLLYPKDSGKDKYLVVDGLQRFTTMLQYTKNPFEFVEQDEFSDSDLMTIILSSKDAKEIYDGYQGKAQKQVLDEMRNIITANIKGRQSDDNFFTLTSKTTKQLCQEVAILPKEDYEQISTAVSRIIDKIEKEAAIDDIEIPLIIFKGEKSELADIFQKLNQEGVKLSKYEVFAATWLNHFVTVNNDSEFINYVIKKYDVAQDDSQLEIADYDAEEIKKTGQLTIFEYAFALGKALKNSCKMLFPSVKDNEVDSIGFLILTEIMNVPYQEMGSLADELLKYKDVLDYRKLKDAVIDAARNVEDAIKIYLTSPAKNGKKSLACHAEYQVASYIIAIFKLKYDLDTVNGLKVNDKNKKVIANIRQYLYKHYLFDILRGAWSGSGDSKLAQITADPTTCRYTRDVAKDEFEAAISGWLEENNSKVTLTNVSTEAKLFLNYLLRGKIYNSNGVFYDVEHCVPKAVIKRFFLDKGITVPMSSVCNLIYIPDTDNRGKGELTYYEKQEKEPGTYTLNQEQLDDLVYPRREELSFVDSTDTITEGAYDAFLRSRKEIILKAVMDRLYKN